MRHQSGVIALQHMDKRPLPGPIAYITGEYPRATDTFIQREISGLRKLGFEVLTCSIRKTGTEHHVGPEQIAEARDTFYVLNAARSPWYLLRSHAEAFYASPKRYFSALRLALGTSAPGSKALLYQLFYFAEAVVLASHLKRNGVIHLHNHIATSSCTVAMLMAEVSGIPFSFTIHGHAIFFEPYRWRLDEKIARARFVACISDFCRSQVMIFCGREHWKKLHVVHCGVEPERYEDAVAAPEKHHPPRILFVGRLSMMKGLSILFEALVELLPAFPGLHLTLIGDGPDRVAFEAEVRGLGLSAAVTFVGYQSQDAVAEALRHTDMLVLPSFAEGVPVVLMEAMAARVPVVTTLIAGIPELVEDTVSGALVVPGDSKMLGERIAEILHDPALGKRMGRAGREKVIADFNVEREAAWLGEILKAYTLNGPRLEKRPASPRVAS